MANDFLKVLMHPYHSELSLPESGENILFINAQYGPELEVLEKSCLRAQQYFFPAANELSNRGFACLPELPEAQQKFDTVWLLVPKQQEERLYMLAQALEYLKDGGVLVAAGPKKGGGARLQKDCAQIGFECAHDSKHHCRIVWGRKKQADLLHHVQREWTTAGGWQEVKPEGVEPFWSRPGLFAWDRVDPATALLCEHIQNDLKGVGADFGCGPGLLSRHLLAQNPDIAALYCVDADARAVEASRRNVEKLSHPVQCHFVWQDLTRPDSLSGVIFDWVVMNPPFHEGATEDSNVGLAFIATAAQRLKPHGKLWMVANAHLPYEPLLESAFSSMRKLFEGHGYKIYEMSK